MSMVCRPILLHNEYVPAIVDDRSYKYLTLGHHDGMTVQKAFQIDTADALAKIFSFSAEYEGKQSSYSTQFFFGFHEGNDEEALFWESDNPFTFVSFIQFKDRELNEYQRYLEGQSYKEDEWKTLKLSEQVRDVRVRAYYALDSTDMILVVRCRKCETGTQMINNLHQDIDNRHPFLIRNSYSILAIERSYIEREENDTFIEGEVEWLELRIIEREKGSINGLYRELESILKKKNPDVIIERKGLLGTEDEAIIIQNVLWKDILPLYREKEGILMNSNSCSQKYASAITTKMLYSIITREEDEVQEIDSGSTPFSNYLYHKVEKIYNGEDTASALTERKNLVMLINALRKIEYSYRVEKTFNDYSFFTIMMPTTMFVRLRERDRDNSAEFYEFIKYVKLCMQNFSKPDRIYQQVTDFNIRYFDIPAKLVALYNAYLYYAKQVLNVGSKGEYEFLLCPGMNRKTEVKELYQGTDRDGDEKGRLEEVESHHLFRVEIPECHIYNLKLMIFILGHEVSHFVGRIIRKREERYESILKLTGRMIVVGLKEHIGYIGEFDRSCFEKRIWDEIEAKIVGWLRFHIEGHLKKEYMEGAEYDLNENQESRIENQIKYYKVFYRHTSTLKLLLNNAVNKILYSKGEELFGKLIWNNIYVAIDSQNDIDEQKEYYEKRKLYYDRKKNLIEECIDAFVGSKAIGIADLTATNGIENIMYLLEECYADMSCILLLKLPLKDYLGNLVEILRTIGYTVENVKETKIITRIAIVMTVMNYELDANENPEECFRWDENQIILCGEEEILYLQEEARNYTKAYIRKEALIEPGRMADRIQRINLDYQMLREIISYLLKCRREYYQKVQHTEEEKVQRFYELTKVSDSANFFAKTVDILAEYEEDIYGEIQKLIESEEGSYGGCIKREH